MDERRYRRALATLRALAAKAGLTPRQLSEHLDLLSSVQAYEEAHVREGGRFAAEARDCRTAIVSDIHGNWAGLEAVLRDIEEQDCQRVVCLGDFVDGGPGDEAVVRWAMEHGIIAVRGNHDEFCEHLDLSEPAREYLSGLPEYWIEGDVMFTHISPRPSIKRLVRDRYEAWNVFDEVDFRLAFIGHTHVSCIYGARSKESASATRHPFEFNQPFQLDPDDRYLVSVGSAGYAREQPASIRYGILDGRAGTVEIRALEGPLLPLGILKGGAPSSGNVEA